MLRFVSQEEDMQRPTSRRDFLEVSAPVSSCLFEFITRQRSLLIQTSHMTSRLCTLQREFCSRCNVRLLHPLGFNGISRAKPLASLYD
jgi:hypothetical protein